MKYKLILALAILFLALPMLSASLGTFNPGDCVPITTTVNATSVILTQITGPPPNATIFVQNQSMTALGGGGFNYTFCNTSQVGKYTYGYIDSQGNPYGNDFQVGDPGVTLVLVLAFAVMLIFSFGYFAKNVWFVYISGILAMVFGVYVISYGYASLANVYTQAIGYIAIGFSIMVFVMGVYEQLGPDAETGDEE